MRGVRRFWFVVPLLACAAPLLPSFSSPQEAPAGKKRKAQGDAASGQEVPDVPVRKRTRKIELAHAPLDAAFGNEMHPRQSPFLVARPGGALLGFLDWKPGSGDRVLVCDAATPTAATPTPRNVNAEYGEIVRPVGVLDAQGRVNVFWSGLVDGSAQLRTAREQEDGSFASPVTLTTGAVPNMNVEAALHSDGKVYIVWETDAAGAPGSEKGQRDIYVAPQVEGGALGERVRVGDGRFADIDPVIASAGGKLWIAWAGYSGRDYEIDLRSYDPASGALSAVIDVSSDSWSDDLHPSLAAAPTGEIWVAWDRVEMAQRGSSMPPRLEGSGGPRLLDISIHAAQVRPVDGSVRVTKKPSDEALAGEVPGAPMLSTGGGLPKLAFDAAGRLWLACRHLHLPNPAGAVYSFPVLLQHLGPGGWSAPVQLDGTGTNPDEPAIAPEKEGVVVAARAERGDSTSRQGGKRSVPTLDVELRVAGVHIRKNLDSLEAIGVAHASADDPVGIPELVERVPDVSTPHFDPCADRLDDPFVSGERHFEVTRGADQWKVYWGELHRHSSISRCTRGMEPRPTERWEWGRDVHLCDFMALTDHSSQVDPNTWRQLDKLLWLYRSPTFCTLAGFEWSTKDWGHHNVILSGGLAPFIGDNDDIEELYQRLQPGQAITIPHHPSDTQFPNDFSVIDGRFTRLIEIYQACRGSYEFDGCFKQSVSAGALGCFAQDAIAQGNKFGIIAATDHDYGQSYACALARSLDRADVFEALSSRRTYGATAKGMFVDLRVNDAVMGEETTCKGPPRVRFTARGATDLADVVVFRNGRIWRSTRKGEEKVANEVAPLRLVVRFPTGGEAPTEPWTLTIRGERVVFEMLDELRPFARRIEVPTWSVKRGIATLTCPAGFLARPSSAEFPMNVRAPPDATLEFETGAGKQSATFLALQKSKVKFEGPGGKLLVGVELGDAVVDLSKSLGTRDYVGEWEDAEFRVGQGWYYGRVIQVDGEIAWSSPVFVKRE